MKFKGALLLFFAALLLPGRLVTVRALCPSLLPATSQGGHYWLGPEKQKLEALLQAFSGLYPDIHFQGSWDSSTVNAQALRFDDLKLVVIYGGLVRQVGMNLDTLALMICHEVGHHKGGAPFFTDSEGRLSWASGEGAADYYSVKSCFLKVSDFLPHFTLKAEDEGQKQIRELCRHQRPLSLDLCLRSILAGLRTAQLQWKQLSEVQEAPRVESFELRFPERTLVDYPSPQCRLDTFIASALFIERPRCWYVPQY